MACVCPKCLNDQFNIFTKREGVVNIIQDETGGSIPHLVSEGEAIVNTEFVSCTKCGEAIEADGSNLVEAVKCAGCGAYALPTEVDDNGQCNNCQIPAELKGLTADEYIKRIISLEKQLKALSAKDDDILIEDIPDEVV